MPIARLTIEEDDAKLDPKVLAEFLSLLEGCVVASHDIGIKWNGDGRLPAEISSRLKAVSPVEWNGYFDQQSTDLIAINTISRQSPIEITLACSISLITIAVVLSGGRIKLSKEGLEAELPPLGTGINALKKALGLGGKVTSGYSIRTISIRLNEDELKFLLVQDPSQRNKGGFQNFLIGLQSRVNRNTRELVLTDVDLERIYRFKANPKGGGFQSRFEKIFGRHFPNELDQPTNQENDAELGNL